MVSPFKREFAHRTPGMATAGTPTEEVLADYAPFDGTLVAAYYAPDTVLTGANTNYRSLQIVNVTKANAVMATIDFVAATNAAAKARSTVTLAAAAARAVSAGDVITFKTTVAGTGLAMPPGKVTIQLQAT